MGDAHEIMSDGGESTAKWAFREPGFIGSIRQFCNCGRCGNPLEPKRHDEPRRYGRKPILHVLCDQCWEDLPE